ncbi:MAG: DMT family transporter [Alphaproteobacteria bacterium]|nr:DMT family transporter [Alphaproteobacteria bacterium]
MTGGTPPAIAGLVPPGLKHYLMLATLALLWGSSQQFTKVAVDSIPPVTITAMRCVVGALILYGALKALGGRLPPLGPVWRPVAIIAVLGNIAPLIFMGWGLERIDSALASILVSVSPLCAMTLAHFTLKDEPMTRNRAIGFGFGMIGVVIVIGPDALMRFGDNVWGQLSIIAAAVSFAFSAMAARRLPPGLDLANAAAVLIVAAMAIVPAALVVDRPWTLSPTLSSFAAALWLSVLPMALATFIYLRLITTVGVNFCAYISYLTPVVGVVGGAFVLGEQLPLRAVVALAMILVGIAIAEWSKLRRR